jgi:DNA mismatch endonuclease (patch repair protein)
MPDVTEQSTDIAPAVSTATRNVMRANKRRDTGPEMKVRRWLHARGYRFRLDYAKLPGRPDVVLPRHKIAIFVHGCYWHDHGCGKGRRPKTNPEFWQAKFARNAERHERAEAAIASLGWKSVVVWDCDLKDIDGEIASMMAMMKIETQARDQERRHGTTHASKLRG